MLNITHPHWRHTRSGGENVPQAPGQERKKEMMHQEGLGFRVEG